MICALNEIFNGVTCVKPVAVEEGEFSKKIKMFHTNSYRYQMRSLLTAHQTDAFALKNIR